MKNIREPDFSKPVDILAFFDNHFGGCGCSEIQPMQKTVIELLEWHSADIMTRPHYDTLFNGDSGVFYIIAGIMTDADLVEHGGSIRSGWITKTGKALLIGLKMFTADEIEDCKPEEAYDGCTYGDITKL
jgi:hypothetical protein